MAALAEVIVKEKWNDDFNNRSGLEWKVQCVTASLQLDSRKGSQ